jgi:hypothetical protein
MNFHRKIVKVILILIIVFTAYPLTVNAEDMSLIFTDDFSIQKDWIDESNGHIFRDASNQWLVWNVNRSDKRRYLIPINAQADQIELNFRFNMTGADGNAGTHFGLIENLEGPYTLYAEVSGVWVDIGWNTSYGKKVTVTAKYSDGTFTQHPTSQGVSYGPFNTWRRGRLSVSNGEATVIVWDENGNELGQKSIPMSQSHSAYNYLMVFFDGHGGWESGSGYLDDIEVWGTPLNQSPIADADGPYVVAVGQTVALDGSGSSDPDGDSLFETWTVTGDALGIISGSTFTAGTEAGITEVTLTVDDGRGGTATDTAMVVVYDPDGGFVTGGGWFDSPLEAYNPDPSLSGRATFGFVSKYKKGASTPTGNTEFQFNTADLNFHSSSYDWLVVTGSDYAKFKGTGMINGEGEYKFQIWAGDNDYDTFRIKIWSEDDLGVETIVYDNGHDQAIGGGSIVIHTK